MDSVKRKVNGASAVAGDDADDRASKRRKIPDVSFHARILASDLARVVGGIKGIVVKCVMERREWSTTT